jgi:hypothetical protein
MLPAFFRVQDLANDYNGKMPFIKAFLLQAGRVTQVPAADHPAIIRDV